MIEDDGYVTLTKSDYEKLVKIASARERHAHWICIPCSAQSHITYKCSSCGRIVELPWGLSLEETYPYCNCGAKMDEGGQQMKAKIENWRVNHHYRKVECDLSVEHSDLKLEADIPAETFREMLLRLGWTVNIEKHAHWIPNPLWKNTYKCSHCGHEINTKHTCINRYCEYCGYKMDEEDK